MKELTLPLICRLALNLDPTHRAEILLDWPSLTAWAKSRCDGSAGIGWALMVNGEPMVAIGVFARGVAGYVWLAGARGWTRHIRKLAPFWAALKSGPYPRLACDIIDGNAAERRWVEHLGFKRIDAERGHVIYGMVL